MANTTKGLCSMQSLLVLGVVGLQLGHLAWQVLEGPALQSTVALGRIVLALVAVAAHLPVDPLRAVLDEHVITPQHLFAPIGLEERRIVDDGARLAPALEAECVEEGGPEIGLAHLLGA